MRRANVDRDLHADRTQSFRRPLEQRPAVEQRDGFFAAETHRPPTREHEAHDGALLTHGITHDG